MDAQYGPLSADFYQVTKPLDADYPDVPYYLEALTDIPGRILEIGAGTGRLLIPLLEAGFQAEALEPSPDMLGWLEKNLKARKLKCPIHRAAAEDFRAKKPFNAIVISFGSFQLFQPRATALQCVKLCRANLAKGGKLFIDIDVIRPELHKSGLMAHGTRVEMPDGTAIVLDGSRRWDIVEQQEHVHLRYEKWKDSKLVGTEIQDFSLRGYGQWEFAALLKESGFKNIAVTSDYGGPEIHADTATFCFTAEA